MTEYRNKSSNHYNNSILSSSSSMKPNLERASSSTVPSFLPSADSIHERQKTATSQLRRNTAMLQVKSELQSVKQLSEDPLASQYPSHSMPASSHVMPASQMGYGRHAIGGYPLTIGYGYGGYGYGMMNPYTVGPLSFIQNINYFMMSIGQFFDLLGISSHALSQTAFALLAALKQLEMKIRTSEFRRWLQKKSKKSKLLRFLFVFGSMAISIQCSKLIKLLLLKYVIQTFGWSTSFGSFVGDNSTTIPSNSSGVAPSISKDR